MRGVEESEYEVYPSNCSDESIMFYCKVVSMRSTEARREERIRTWGVDVGSGRGELKMRVEDAS